MLVDLLVKEEIDQHGTDEEKECRDKVLYEEAGSGEKTLQNGWKRGCDPVTGKVLDSRQVPDAHGPDGKRWHAILRLHGARCGAILQIDAGRSLFTWILQHRRLQGHQLAPARS